MAYCVDDGEGIFIVVAPKLSRGSESRIQAILRHELAHALEFEVGEKRLREMAASDGKKLHRGAERRADQVAEIIWGDPIFYDNIEVQTLDRGTYPRPIHLGE
jgi:precorrin-2 methylase